MRQNCARLLADQPPEALYVSRAKETDQGCVNHEVHIVNWNTGILEAENA